MSAANALVAVMIDRLAGASVAIALMVAVAWLAGRLRPSLTPATRTTVWWLVAVAALLRLAPLPSLTLEVPEAWNVGAILPTRAAAPVATTASTPAASATAPARTPHAIAADVPPLAPPDGAPARIANTPFVPTTVSPARASTTATRTPPLDWRAPVVMLWAAVAAALLLHLTAATRRLRALARSGDPAPADVDAEASTLANALGLRRTPPIRVSEAIDTPQVLGLLHPTVLLPADALTTLSPRERTMTLCHELVHVRRRDLAFAWAPAVMERLLFFHPAARLAAREYAFAREAACDAEVLQHLGEAPRDYGRLLLRLGVTRRPAALAAAQSSPSARLLRRRLAMLNDHATRRRPARGLWLAGTCVLALSMPLSLVARQDGPPPLPPIPPAPPALAAPVVPPLPPLPPSPPSDVLDRLHDRVTDRVVDRVSRRVSERVYDRVVDLVRSSVPVGLFIDDDQVPPPPPPPPPAPARATMPPPPPPPPPPPSGSTMWISSDADETWVLLDGRGSHVFSGSWRDAEEVKRLRGSDDGPFLFYRSGGRTYVSKDRALIDRVKAEMREQQQLGAEQGALGARQGELGAQQAALGHQQGALGMRHHEVAAAMAADHVERSQLAALEGSLAALEMRSEGQQSAEVVAARKAVREAIEALRRAGTETTGRGRDADKAKADRMHDVGAQQQDLARRQAELGAKQAELGRLQAELGEKQRVAAAAARKRILAILEDARAKGQVESIR